MKSASVSKTIQAPLYLSPIHAGFPSPADDFVDKLIDLNEYLIQHPSATYLLRAKGMAMVNVGIYDGDTLIVDKSLTPKNSSIIVAFVDGDFVVRTLIKSERGVFLIPANPEFSAVQIRQETDFQVWGVVIYTIHKAP